MSRKMNNKSRAVVLTRRTFLGGTLAGILFTAAGAPAVKHERERQRIARRPRPIWIGHM